MNVRCWCGWLNMVSKLIECVKQVKLQVWLPLGLGSMRCLARGKKMGCYA